MASSITVESLDLGEALVDEAEALVTYRRLAVKAGLSEKIATFLVNDMGCRRLEDLENVSEAQVDEKIIPAITGLDVPLVMGSRLKKLIKSIQEAAKVSWERKRKGTVEDEDVPLPSEELKRLESLFFNRYKLRVSADEDAGETVVSRLKRQLNRHCIRFENILKTRTRKGETAETRVKRTKLGDKTELVEREEPERRQPRTITVEVYLDALWTYILGLARAGIEEVQDKPSAAETEGAQTYDYVQIPLDVTMNYHSRAKRFAASLPKDRALAILKEIDEAERMLWTERVRGPKAGMVIHQIMMERAHVWVWHDKPGERQPTTSTQSLPGKQFQHQPNFTPRAVGTWATENRGGRILCQAYQKNQCAGDSCSMGAHVCAMVVRDSGHVCGLKHPACKHRWDMKAAKQGGGKDNKKSRR